MGRFHPKLQLTEVDFDAYAPERTRAASMPSTASGSVVKRLLAWAKAIAATLSADGIELDVSASDEHPSARNGHRVDAQSVSLFRSESARRTMQRMLGTRLLERTESGAGHARIELRVDAAAVTLVLWLGGDARADLEHAAWAFAHGIDDETVWQTLGNERAAIEARASLSPRAKPLCDVSPEEAATMAKQALESEVPLVIGFRLTRAAATQPHALDTWTDGALALGRLLSLVWWTPESSIRASERPSRRGKRASPKDAPAQALSEPPKLIEAGTHVRALAGPFAGQAGVVQELDGKGGARVLFGLLTTRVELRDLAVQSGKRGRPVMSSSHRKPTS